MDKQTARIKGITARASIDDVQRTAKDTSINQQLIDGPLAFLIEEFRTEKELTNKMIEEQSVDDELLQKALDEMYGVQPMRKPYIGVYRPIGGEVAISAFIEAAHDAQCIVCYPALLQENRICMVRFSENDPALPQFDFLNNPGKVTKLDVRGTSCRMVAPEDIDILLVPVTSFDDERHFTGRGGAAYDDYIPRTGLGCRVIGVGYAEQQVDQIDTVSFDCCVREIVSA